MITAVDIGATKTLIAQFDADMNLGSKIRFPTAQDPVTFLTDLQNQLNQFKNISILSVGIPGIAVNGIAVECPNLPAWHNVRLKEELQKIYNCPVHIENDANLAALAEINILEPIPKLGLYLTVSTGIGSGLIANGVLIPSMSHTELGHMVLLNDGVWQEWQQFASGSALKAHFNKLASELDKPEDWQWVAEKIGAGLCALIPAILPDVIVFGGGVGNHFEQFAKPLEALLAKRLSNPKPPVETRLVMASHPNEAVLYGCYYYATHQQTT